MRKQKMIPRQATDAVFHVTYYREGNIAGWLSHSRMDQPIYIQSVPQLIFNLDDLFSRDDRPISIRVFEEVSIPDCPFATLRVQILFREHYSWQGLLIWEDNQMEAPFHSVLEFIELLDELLAN